MHKEVYLGSGKVSKRDKLGIYSTIEKSLLESLALCIKAVYKKKSEKKPVLEEARIRTEIIKQVMRTAYEIGALEERNYLRFQKSLQEISKMTNGWIKYLEATDGTQNPPMSRRM